MVQIIKELGYEEKYDNKRIWLLIKFLVVFFIFIIWYMFRGYI